MRRDISTNLGAVDVITPAVMVADNTPAAIDIRNFAAAVICLSVGIGGITFTDTNKIEFKLTHSDDDASYTAVTDADVKGVTVATGGVVLNLVAEKAAASLTKIGYHGGKRYLKLLADFSGTHGTGTPVSAVAILGEPRIAPV